MGYNVIDLIDKAIDIAIRKKHLYEIIGEQQCDIPSIKVMSKVLMKDIDRSIKYYETLKKEIGYTEFEEIDFDIYDKISFLINEFNSRLNILEVHDVREFLNFSLTLERDTYSLLINIQGRLIKDKNDVYTKTYIILSKSIENKARHIETLQKVIK